MGTKRGRRVTPKLMSDIDRVWRGPQHPSVGGDLLNDAAKLAPTQAADLLLDHMPKSVNPVTLSQRLDSIGIALGTLTPSFGAKGDARSLWRSTLPVMLVSKHPRRNALLAREIAEQVGYLIYGSTRGEPDHRQVRDFANEFQQAFSGV